MERLKQRKRFMAIILLIMLGMVFNMPVKSEAAEYIVTNKGSVSDGVSQVGKFTIGGKPVFCCDHDKTTPSTGTKAVMTVENDGDIAKTLYYGYSGPGQWSGFEDDDEAIVATSLVLDYYFNKGDRSGNPNFKKFIKFLETQDTSESGTSYLLYKTGKEAYQRLVALNPAINIKVQISKESADKSITDGNACYSLKGAQYGVYHGNTLLKTVTTDQQGKASCSITVSPEKANDITIREIKASKGFALDKKVYTKNGSQGEISIISEEPPVRNPVEAAIHKLDSEKSSDRDGGSQNGASLAGAIFRVDFYGIDEKDIPKDKNFDGHKPLRTWYFETDSEGLVKWGDDYLAKGYSQSEFYKDPSDDTVTVLPLGVVTVKEIKAPEGYLINKNQYVCAVTEDGMKERIDVYQPPKVAEDIIRGDLDFRKIEEGSNHRMSGIPFMITALDKDGEADTKGESHILVTDENGYASTDSSFNLHDNNTNINDMAWDGEKIDDSKLDQYAGIWFGEIPALDNERGALPYGRYIIDELPCEKNEGYTLLKGIEVKISRNNHTIEMGTLLNKPEKPVEDENTPSIGTTVRDGQTQQTGETVAREDFTLIDRVDYRGLEKGAEYTIEGILMDKETGKSLIVEGNEIRATETFTAEDETGYVDVEFSFDGSSLTGGDIVVFEELKSNGVLIAEHKDINDIGQTIKIKEKPPVVETGDRIQPTFMIALIFMTLSALIVLAVCCGRRLRGGR